MYVKEELKPTHVLTSLQEKDGENRPYRPSLLESKSVCRSFKRPGCDVVP